LDKIKKYSAQTSSSTAKTKKEAKAPEKKEAKAPEKKEVKK